MNNGNLNVHIREWGDIHKPVIFCLHGLGSTSLSFIEIAERLKHNFRIISIDAPGHGKTPPFREAKNYEMPQLAMWINHLLDNLEIEKFYFLSHSWGSFVSLYYLLQYPERVKGTILIDGGYQTKRRMEQSMEEEVTYYVKDFEEYAFDTWEQFLNVEKEAYTRWSPLMEVAVKDLALEKNNKIYWHVRGLTAKYIIEAMHKHETEDIYGKLPSNILLLRATLPKEQDLYRDKAAKIFEQETGGTVKLIHNTTHMLHWDKPDAVVEEIKKNWAGSC
jgi:pimeloyl-ACP methyl ester carboxylesterase